MKDRSSYTPFFFAFLSLLLLALTVWVIWKDEIQLRPWKEYQQEYKELKASKLQSEYDEAVTLFQSSGDAQKLESLKARLDETDRIFQSKEVQDKYKGLAAQKDIVEASLDENQKQLQEKRGKFLQVEYLYIRDQREQDKKTMQVLQNEIGSLTENRDALLKQKNSIEEKIGDLTKDREALLAEMQSLRKGLDEKLAAIESNERMSEGIKQVHIRDADKADRCITCHIGIESSYRLTDSQPLTPHPARFVYLENHPVSDFGCTFCHRGQGRATTSPDKAHGWVHHWTEPMLQGRMTQASCISCHEDTEYLRGAEFLAEGSGLIKKYGCYGCHMIPGYEGLREIGPVLAEVGTKVNYSWAVNWLQDPKNYYEAARMPKFYFSKEEAESIADYLFSMTGTTRHDMLYTDDDIDWDLVEKGKAIWGQSRCNICHVTNGQGGAHAAVHAPDLSKVGSKVSKEWLFKWIKDPKKYFPETKMPRYRFSDEEITALVEYIVGEYQDFDFEPDYEEAVPIKAESIEKGKALVEKYGCFGCHKLKGMEDMQNIAPQLLRAGATVAGGESSEKIGAELSSIGSKPLELLDFGKMKGKIPHSRESYVQQKLRAPRSYRDDLRMPDFRFTEEEIKPLSAVLLGFTDATRPLRYIVPGHTRLDQLENEFGSHPLAGVFSELAADVKCLNCHQIKGHGYDFAPDLTIAGSKLQESWIRKFLDQPDVIRPMLKQMPRFNLGKQLGMIQGNLKPVEIETVVNYFRTELVSGDIPATLPELEETPDADPVELGRKLYDEKGCVACHQIGSEGGTVGPNITNVGNRLTAGFIFKYLEDPRKFSSENVEPDYGFSERERVYLTRYLMSLKKSTSNAEISETRSEQ
ncbi:MAG: c-type cytochrome [Chlorobium sp.]|nr:c-type cytochrome [Chlorobium sp.]MCW8818870.1 c-type cytochrome [Ignavibacteriaceae bacterium]